MTLAKGKAISLGAPYKFKHGCLGQTWEITSRFASESY